MIADKFFSFFLLNKKKHKQAIIGGTIRSKCFMK